MKLRVTDRLLAALNALILLWVAACMISDMFMGGRCFELLTWLVADAPPSAWTVGVMVFLVIVAALDLAVLLRKAGGEQGFVIQNTENGELSISIRAIETLVHKCVDKHEELHVSSTMLVNTRKGLVVKLRVSIPGGTNIPLVVSGLQKQIRQYITACSGVDVKEVRVQVEGSDAAKKDSLYQVPEMLSDVAPVPAVEMTEAPAAETVQEPAESPVQAEEQQPEEETPAAEEPAAEEPAAEESAEEAAGESPENEHPLTEEDKHEDA